MMILLFIHGRGRATSRAIAAHMELSIEKTRSHLSKMGRLGLLFKEVVTARQVDYVLTYDGIAVAKCLEVLTARISLNLQKGEDA